MRVRVEFRYNAETGEVELFQVDDIGRTTRVQDHDAAHEQIAFDLGQVLDRRPGVEEVVDVSRGRESMPAGQRPAAEDENTDAVRRDERLRQGDG
ncbi:hypothetical protein [Streptomyces sp. YIM S03343]